ncbi:MAG: hypothetical protein ACHBN1_08995 [Heteroscytonema crispum UTEX LB 1556]
MVARLTGDRFVQDSQFSENSGDRLADSDTTDTSERPTARNPIFSRCG